MRIQITTLGHPARRLMIVTCRWQLPASPAKAWLNN